MTLKDAISAVFWNWTVYAYKIRYLWSALGVLWFISALIRLYMLYIVPDTHPALFLPVMLGFVLDMSMALFHLWLVTHARMNWKDRRLK